MAQKTLHGKRHIRARKTVRAGREKRAEKRLSKFVKEFSGVNLQGVVNKIIKCFQEFGEAVSAIGTAAASGASALPGARVQGNIKGNHD